MNKVLERGKRFCGYIVGIVFFLSGMTKLLDPVGAGLVMKEYFDFLHISFLDFSAKYAGFSFALFETLIGVALITGLWRKVIAFVTLCFLGFFTLLTLALVIFNPAMDCGCFGEVLHLTHLQTFLKNIVLCVLACASFFPFSALGRPKKRKYVTFGIVTTVVIVFAIYSWIFIPLKDYTDFRPGARLAASPAGQFYEGEGSDAYEAVFIYEKDGRTEQFTLENLPDSTWTFISTETMRKQESLPSDSPVPLPVMDEKGEMHDEVAAAPHVIIISVYDPKSIGKSKWTKIAERLAEISAAGYKPLLMVSAIPEDLHRMIECVENPDLKSILTESLYFSDYKTLISLNRSNAGCTFFHAGHLIRKWAYVQSPDGEELTALASADPTETYLSYSSSGALIYQAIFLFAFAAMLLI